MAGRRPCGAGQEAGRRAVISARVLDQALAAGDDGKAVEVEEGEAGTRSVLDLETGRSQDRRQLARSEVAPVTDVAVEGRHRPAGTVTTMRQPGAR